MLRRRSTLVAAVALVSLATAAGAQVRHPRPHRAPPRHHRPAPGVAAFSREIYPPTAVNVRDAGRYQVLMLQADDAAILPQLHAVNRRLKVLMYQDVLLTRPADPGAITTCTPYQLDVANHPDWFLHDTQGRQIPDGDYPGNYVMDAGNPAYQQACVSHAVALAKQRGFDGVYFDDISAWVRWAFAPGVVSTAYPTPGGWQTALYPMIVAAGSVAHANGLMAIGNIGGARITPGLWQRWVSPLDGAEEQSWTDAGLGTADQILDWPTKLANVAWSEAHGKYTVLHSYQTSETGNTYGLASMMLVAKGRSSYTVSSGFTAATSHWFPEYSTSQRLGAPKRAYRRRANGVYERLFANGIVLVNPTSHAISPFWLRAAYRGPGIARTSWVRMGPTSGLILLRTR